MATSIVLGLLATAGVIALINLLPIVLLIWAHMVVYKGFLRKLAIFISGILYVGVLIGIMIWLVTYIIYVVGLFI